MSHTSHSRQRPSEDPLWEEPPFDPAEIVPARERDLDATEVRSDEPGLDGGIAPEVGEPGLDDGEVILEGEVAEPPPPTVAPEREPPPRTPPPAPPLTPPDKPVGGRWRTLRRGLVRGLLGLFLGYQLWCLGHIFWWREHAPTSTAFMAEGLKRLQQKNPAATLSHIWVPYEAMATPLKRAVLAAEDSGFRDHFGFDWNGLHAALERNLNKGRIVSGGSTISQQLAKNLFLSSSRSVWRKVEEALITLMLESLLSKRRILEIYLNCIEWGNGVYGIEAAARHYYKISAAELTPGQAATLASMIPQPRYFDRVRHAASLKRKSAIIAKRMSMVKLPG
ncbi:MAG: monofunctional biosynthetic peptidoglycan transglycosylase [Magnetococcales bacterium]|nr:monofunctional biosynthetic peptidoglycan transglycosylase [Magnetococcales bacterium]MBF0310212.1 monofunctional biosynthetic peptidoglycan transglycosylase [Magnetococcales bacterium]